MLEAFGERVVTVRALDTGADKPLPFVDLGTEPSPALGVRGLRVASLHPNRRDAQLTALARAVAASGAHVKVIAPMVTSPGEARDFAARARDHGRADVGVMVVIPATALRAQQLCAEVDLLSRGTNDLSQYAFAADRMTGALTGLLDPWQPALLDLIAQVGDAGVASGTPTGVCGEAAGDPLLACVLAGLGVTSFAMDPGPIPMLKATLGPPRLDTCKTMAITARSSAPPKPPAEQWLHWLDQRSSPRSKRPVESTGSAPATGSHGTQQAARQGDEHARRDDPPDRH